MDGLEAVDLDAAQVKDEDGPVAHGEDALVLRLDVVKHHVRDGQGGLRIQS